MSEKELRDVIRVVYDGIAWTLGSRDVLTKDSFVHQILYVANGSVSGALGK